MPVSASMHGTADLPTKAAEAGPSGAAAPIDCELAQQEIAREDANRGAPALQSPLRVNPLVPGEARIQHRYALPFSESLVNAVRKVVRIVLQLVLIVAICLAGEKAAELLPVDVPGNICSMVLLLVLLGAGVVRMESIADAADFLLDNMAIFFIPAAVAIMGSFDLLANSLVKLVVICLVTTVLVFLVTSFTVSTVANLLARREERRATASQRKG